MKFMTGKLMTSKLATLQTDAAIIHVKAGAGASTV